MKLVTDEAKLRLPYVEVTKSEGLAIGRSLLKWLTRYNKTRTQKQPVGVGLASCQLGIYKRVCVVCPPGHQIILVNPRIVKHATVKFSFEESCLSLPGLTVTTYRWPWLTIRSDNCGLLTFGNTNLNDANAMFAAVIAQHETAHCWSKLITDFTREDYPDWGN